jgi:hypothetical protein
MLKNTKASNKRIRFTAIEPTLLLADSKASAVTVQQQAVNKAANSPMWLANMMGNGLGSHFLQRYFKLWCSDSGISDLK